MNATEAKDRIIRESGLSVIGYAVLARDNREFRRSQAAEDWLGASGWDQQAAPAIKTRLLTPVDTSQPRLTRATV